MSRYGRARWAGPPVPRDQPWRTGDRAQVDEDGFLWFTGRADDIIISAGYRIGPFEVESALCAHPAVEEAAPYKYPRQLEFVERLPKTASGKIKRAELRRG